MHFWYGPEQVQPQLLSLLWLGIFLLGARLLSRLIPGTRALAIPDALVAGALGLALGSSAFNLVPLDEGTLKLVVYHGGALIFLVLALRAPEGKGSRAAIHSYAFAIPLIATIQAIIGVGAVTLLGYHLGVGLMLPLGFSQGPGVALSMGDAWESTSGMPDGGQVGLMVSGMGFAVCCVLGVLIFHLGRRRGWLHQGTESASEAQLEVVAEPEAGDIDPLSFHVVLIGLVYLLTFALLFGLSQLIGDRPKIVAQLWGFHFLFGLGLAVLTRRAIDRSPARKSVSNQQLNRIAGLVVDFTACAAVSAVRLDLLAKYWLILSIMTILGAITTGAVCLWLARRAFFGRPFEEILVMFGALTGTLPTGLTLLRLVDPKMTSSVAPSYVMGSGAAVLPAIVLLGLLPVIVSHPDQTLMWIGILVCYGLILVGLWWKTGGLRFTKPLGRVWPDVEES
jgi:ESS family glutamate:Na+ symporter